MSARRFFLTFMTALTLFGGRAGAVMIEWNDLTDAQQEQAYQKLQDENESLKARIKELEEQLGTSGTQESQAAGSAEQDGTSVTTGSSAEWKDVSSFLNDIAVSFNARQNLARTIDTSDLSGMSEAEMWEFRFNCAQAEKSFYDSYKNAQFDDLNIFYLCSEYCQGLGKQFQAEEVWNSSADSNKANELYTAGYYNRAYALVELCEYYGLDLASEYANLKSAVQQMDALSGEETRNAAADSATVMRVQELLNEAGFRCGTPDGIAGRQTASCIERFQKMYGFEPADGIIDEELISQLQKIINQAGN